MVRKVGPIFVILDGVAKGGVRDADVDSCTTYLITDLGADDADTSLESLQERTLENSTFRSIY
jgi:hypothetical protein